jgi:hypothetical protein
VLAVRLIEQVGAYAGIAAIPGLAVLSALYFSQARDVKRLREWAGRAPERAAEQAQGGRVAVPGAPAVAAQPAATAQPAAGEAKPATTTAPGAATPAVATAAVAAAAGAQTATAAGPAAPDADKTDNAATNGEAPPAEAPAADKPAALTPAAVASAAAAKSPGTKAGGTVTRTGPPAVGGAAKPPPVGSPTARRPIPRMPSSQTSILTPREAPPHEPWYRRLVARLPAARYVALIVAGALVLGGGAAFGISQLASEDSGGSDKATPSASGDETPPSDEPSSKDDENVTARPAVNPADVTVTVVNGTTIPNLARDTAAKLSAIGFQIGNKVTGTGSLAAAESVVQYKPGAEDGARYVAAKLDISQKQPADPDALAQAGTAQVIVVLGADQAPGG